MGWTPTRWQRNLADVICAILACFMAFLLPLTAAPKALPDITGKVVVVYCGDTITILTAEKAQVKIRLEGIDAPEAK